MKRNRIINPILMTAFMWFSLISTSDAERFFEHAIFHTPSAQMSGVEGDVIAIVEAPNGLMWFVTSNGLWRWDSHVATRAVFSTEEAQPQIQTVFTDINGAMLVGTNRGLYSVNEHALTLSPLVKTNSSSISIQEIASSEHSIFAAADRGVFSISRNDDRIDKIPLPYDARIHALYAQEGFLWIGTGNGLLRYSIRDKTFSTIAGFPDGVRVSAITAGIDKSILIGTANRGLFVSSDSKVERHFSFNSASEPWIYSATQATPTTVLLGTFGKGLIELDIITGDYHYHAPDPLHPASLGHDNVWALHTDSRGLVWLGANTSLQVYDIQRTETKQVFGGLNGPGLRKRHVNAVDVFGGQLIVGTGRSGLEAFDPITGNAKVLWDDEQDPIETLYAINDTSVLASSNFKTVFIDVGTGQEKPLLMSGRPVDTYSSAFSKTDDVLWVGGTDGLWMFNQSSQSAENLLADADHERRVASLLAAEDKLWVGTWHGLYAIDLPVKAEPAIVKAPNTPDVLEEQFVSSLFSDSKDRIWVGTSGAGLFVLENNTVWRQIDVATNQSGGNVEAIAGESHGYLFVSTSQKIVAVDLGTLDVFPIIEGETTANKPFRRGAAAMMPNGVMVFGGNDGLTFIDAGRISVTPSPLPLLVTNTHILTENNEHLTPSLASGKLSVPPLLKRMSFEFTALEFLAPKQVYYRYRVLGLDDEWSITDAEHRVITITQPEPGLYTLQVSYSLDGHHWQETSLALDITVPPAWYQTWYARFSFALVLLFGIYVVHKMRVQKLRRRQIVLERRVAERTAELVEANKVLNKQAEALREASLTDALTGLHNRRYLGQNIERDIAKLHRYYEDCNRRHATPSNDSDLLFLLIDLDHFKSINDSFGHQAGDLVLVETQYRLKQVFRDIDYIIRWGGEEFLVVVQNTPRADAKILAERLLLSIGGTPYVLKNGHEQNVTCSIGFAAYPLMQKHYCELNWETTIAIADIALYAAKNNQRNTWMGFTEILPETTQQTIQRIHSEPALILENASIETRSSNKPSVEINV